MYKLYFSPGACSLATQVVLRELKQPFELLNKGSVADYRQINPVGAVPALDVNGKVLTEGAAILLYLLQSHANELLPQEPSARQKAIENLTFANATVHPAYGKLFFVGTAIEEGEVKQQVFAAAAKQINELWQQVETSLESQPYLGGYSISPADILLTVYASWGQFFPVEIVIGPQTQSMIDKVKAMESFRASVAAEQAAS